jgi:hypothetical protein
MKRPVQTINLPGHRAGRTKSQRLVRGAQGHVLYQPNQESECANHSHCAYNGKEPDRCPFCHVQGDRHQEGECSVIPNGTRPCLCRTCEEVFSSTAAFDKHQVRGECTDPGSRGLVLVERGGWTVWGFPGSNPAY